jgi:hypothetical protein
VTRPRLEIGGLINALRRVLPIALWAVLPIVVTVAMVVFAVHEDSFALDFHHAFWPAGDRILHGLSPYVAPDAPEVSYRTAFVYPAPAALALAPFALIPREIGDVLFTALNLAAVPLTLWVLAIRDWRVYGVAMLWSPVVTGWQAANITLLLGLGVALLWRHRDRAGVAGVLVALLISAKLFLWPLGLWLLATRRYASVAWATLVAIAINAVAWAVLGFDELGRYRDLLAALTRAMEGLAYSPIAFVLHHGGSRGLAYAVGLGIAGVVACACVAYGRRGDDASAIVLAVAVSLLAAPLVWNSYLALLIVPLALTRPRLDAVWIVPLAMWVCPAVGPNTAELVIALMVMTVVVAATIRSRDIPSRRVVAVA